MKLTKLHVNSIGVLAFGSILASVLAVVGHECFASSIFAGSLGLAINFAEKSD